MDPTTEDRVVRDEGTPGQLEVVTMPPGQPMPSRVVEAVGYVGGALAALGGVIVVGAAWEDLSVWVRLALLGVAVVALIGGGFVMPGHLGATAGRLRSAFWALGVVAATGLFAVVAVDLLHREDEDVFLPAFAPAAVVAAVLWWRCQRVLQQAAMLALVLLSASALAEQLTLTDSAWLGAEIWALGTACMVLAWLGWFPPRVAGVSLGALAALLGSYGMLNDLGFALGFLTAAALVVLAVRERRLTWLAVAATAVMLTGPSAAFDWFPGRLGAALSLVVPGGLILAAAVWVTRHRSPPGRHAR
ncbi:hypothetical protein ACFP3Q_01405 [Nocardioides sp. GCM10027113]|uniref:hypothetical protein n=1 Tax=unclassified Nocardioides TaxID=2615069 RepID=UPI0036240CE1